MMRKAIGAGLALSLMVGGAAFADEGKPTRPEPGVRGFAVRAPGKVKVDGKLDEWSKAFCTPVAYNHKDPANRAAQFFYLWDDEALYIGLRALDQKQGNQGGTRDLFNGDAVEFYLDARTGDAFRGKDWGPGALHMYFTAFDKDKVGPRWSVRKGIATGDVELKGVEIAATSDATGYDLEFKLPWANFPDFAPKTGAVLALDAELCYADGARRVDRTFAYGSPLSVQQPASQAKVQLVDSFEGLAMLHPVAASVFPMWVETPWVQPERARGRAVVALPPNSSDETEVESVQVLVHGVSGVGGLSDPRTLPATIESFGPEGKKFRRAVATWPIDDFAPGTFVVTARVITKAHRQAPGGSLSVDLQHGVAVAPRLIQEAITTGR